MKLSKPVLVAALLRLALVVCCDRLAADVLRYHKLAEHLLDSSWNPYLAPRLYPYPPVWMWWEAASLALSRATSLAFPVLVKLPVVAAELGIVALLERRAGSGAAWLYALHPVALLISGAHGQFDSLALLSLLLCCIASRDGRCDASALWLALAIGLKSFPALLLPFLAIHAARSELATGGSWPPPAGWNAWSAPARAAARYAALALGPVVLALLPFLWQDPSAVGRELFGYGGVADFGWWGAARGLLWLAGAAKGSSLASQWPLQVSLGKAVFLLAWVALAGLAIRRRLPPERAAFLVLLGFVTLYPAISAQYLLWPVPFALWCRERRLRFDLSAGLALIGFYLFLAPGVLWPDHLTGEVLHAAGVVWALGACATWATGALWLLSAARAEVRE